MARLNGEMLCCYPIPPFHSTYQGGSVRPRDDVGIVPYDHDGPQSIQHTFAIGVPGKNKVPCIAWACVSLDLWEY